MVSQFCGLIDQKIPGNPGKDGWVPWSGSLSIWFLLEPKEVPAGTQACSSWNQSRFLLKPWPYFSTELKTLLLSQCGFRVWDLEIKINCKLHNRKLKPTALYLSTTSIIFLCLFSKVKLEIPAFKMLVPRNCVFSLTNIPRSNEDLNTILY